MGLNHESGTTTKCGKGAGLECAAGLPPERSKNEQGCIDNCVTKRFQYCAALLVRVVRRSIVLAQNVVCYFAVVITCSVSAEFAECD